ncbi:MAG TPA: TonB-dependent receptor [Candidatus Saccharimonadales bacterium]|jgi:outer membrane receptor protein involved in Fe transport|nr:TonB-dependent receptor [Candidatus Saccharimonadales bacterium]
MYKKVAFSPWMLLLCVFLSASAFAQTTASIIGTVTDPSGAAVVGAKITVKNAAQGIERSAESGSAGGFEVPALPPGSYSVSVDAKGFQKQQANNLVLAVSQNSVQNFNLTVASSAEVVTVEATSPIIETTTMTVGQTIDQHTVQEIPLNGRHFVDLGLLIPGSVTPPQNGFLTAPLRGQGSFAFNTAGNREDTVNFLVNGINLNDMVQNQITFQPSINTVSEFKVDNSTYSAEYGRNSGAIVNIATRSGSNSYHGEAFEFLRNHDFDARNFFNPTTITANGITSANPQSTFKRNQFGAAFGGPIRKDKTFFFLSYEGTRQRQGITLNTVDLSNAQRQAVIAAGNPTSVKLLSLIPAANNGNSFVGSATAPVDIDQGTADISHNLTSNIRLHGYYAAQHDLRQEPTLQGNSLPGFGDTRESKRQIATFSVDQTISSTMVNEARLGFNRIHISFLPNAKQNPADFGIQDGINSNSGLPQIAIGTTGVNIGGPAGFPQARGDTTAALGDTLSYIRGKHSFKFGGEFRRFYNNNINGDAGTLSFANVTDFANGAPNSFSLSPGNLPSRIATGELGFFGQDNWKLTNRLTLELGLRYDWNQTPTEAFNRFANFSVVTAPSLPTQGTGALTLGATPYHQNNKNVQPRVGFAWDAFGNGSTVVRSGYAVLTDQPITNLVTGLTTNPPLGTPLTFNGPGTTTYANLLTAAKNAGLAPTIVDPNFDNSYVESYNLNVQQQLSKSWSLMVGYFGSEGKHLRTRVNLNQFVNGVRPFATAVVPGQPAPVNLGNISDNVSNGSSTYNALWVSSNLRAWHGLQFNASYTYSKSLDFTSQNGQGVVIQNSLNPAGDKGLSDFNARNRFSTNFIYSLPFKGNRFVEGWQVGSIIQSQSGNPINILAASASPGANIASLTGVASIRPDQIGAVQILGTPGTGGIVWFANSVCDPAVAPCAPGTTFAIPDANGNPKSFHFGNLGRNAILGPGFNDVDFSIIKRTKISERFSHEFRFESFDLLNHPNFGQPNRVAQVGSKTFGVINSTRFPIGDSGSARQLQFAMKLIF